MSSKFEKEVQERCDEILADASALVETEELYKVEESKSRLQKLFEKIF